MRRIQALVAAALVGALALPTGAGGAAGSDAGQSAGDSPGIHVGYGPIATSDDRAYRPHSAASFEATRHPPDGAIPFLVQFGRPITAEDLTQLDRLGAHVLDTLSPRTLRIRMADPQRLEDHPGIQRIGAPAARRFVHTDIGADETLARLVLDPDVTVADTEPSLLELGVTVLSREGGNAIVITDRAQAEAAIDRGLAAWAEPIRLPRPHNDGAAAIVGAPAAAAGGFDGTGQIIAVADTGLGGGTDVTAHRDIPSGRISAVVRLETAGVFGCYAVFDDGSADVDSGHGTHVATTALGDGGPNGEGQGLAPGASLYFQSVEDYVAVDPLCEPFLDDGYALIGIPLDLADLLEPAYAAGARVHQDSWGAAVQGDYDASAADVDDFIHSHPDLTMIVSAGNDGADANEDGSVDGGSLSSPATAKNVIAVGASENDRAAYPCDALNHPTCASNGGNNTILPYGWPAEPYATDLYAGAPDQMAAFSSRGPTTDGRIKPDVVAPGTWMLSGYSDMYQQHYDSDPNPLTGAHQDDGWGDPLDEHYKYFGGTSMAAPVVSGGAALVRQFYADSGSWNASAALVKATLINSATDLADENNDGVEDNAEPIPNIHEGWGRIDLALATDGSHGWFDDADVDAGMAHTYATAVRGSTPLRVSLVWSDPAGSPGCTACLINDLDLQLSAPDGTVYVGNNFAGGWTRPGPAESDRVNNVENVYVPDPPAGVWTMRVVGAEVPSGSQPFALVFDADFDTTIDVLAPTWPSVAISVDALTSDSVTMSWSPAADDTIVVGYDIFRGEDLVDTVSSTEATIDGLHDSTAYTFRVEARDARGNRSDDGPEIEVHTLDGTAPRWIQDAASLLGVGETWVRVGWSFPVDLSEIAGYESSMDGVTLALGSDALEITFTGLIPATEYTIALTATDIAGNRSDPLRTRVRTATDFDDTNNHTFEEDIAWLSGMGITGGCTPDTFCPNAPMTRAQMASLLARALNLEPVSESRFSDVSGVHAGSINAIAEAGISVGCDGNRFCPIESVTRAQMATFLDRALGLDPADDDYFDDDNGSVHEAAINRVAAAGITLGCADGRYCPTAGVSRGQIAAFLHRALTPVDT